MPALEKATLVKLSAGANPTEVGSPVPVQFNPASLRLALSNQVEGGVSRGRQRRQFNGQSSTDLSFELVFDTADEGTTDSPRSVREKTALVEQFVLPATDPQNSRRRQAPPKVRFHWGDLTIDGVISSLTLDFEHFAANGTPLRAKMNVSIREQDSKYEARQEDEAQSGGGAPSPGQPGAAAPGGGAGGGSGPDSDRSATALDGESAADFAARNGLDPAAWRGLAAGLDGTLSLKAGLEIDFNSSLSLGVGLGATAGIQASAAVGIETAFGLDGAPSAGFALSRAGGVTAAIEQVAVERTQAAAASALRAFGAGPSPSSIPKGAATAARPTPPDQPRPPLRTSPARPSAQVSPTAPAAQSAGSAQSAQATRDATPAPAPPPPKRDARAATFGFGVPLKPRARLDGSLDIGAAPAAPEQKTCGCCGPCHHQRTSSCR